MTDVKYRELLKQLRADGWEIVVIRGSHRQLKHPQKRGRVTVAGHPGDEIHPRTLKSIRRQAGWED
jgi:predicted RNA binding protein YcfA (HicA-like mRNA interferase family)